MHTKWLTGGRRQIKARSALVPCCCLRCATLTSPGNHQVLEKKGYCTCDYTLSKLSEALGQKIAPRSNAKPPKQYSWARFYSPLHYSNTLDRTQSNFLLLNILIKITFCSYSRYIQNTHSLSSRSTSMPESIQSFQITFPFPSATYREYQLYTRSQEWWYQSYLARNCCTPLLLDNVTNPQQRWL